jgi:hypothetical protein
MPRKKKVCHFEGGPQQGGMHILVENYYTEENPDTNYTVLVHALFLSVLEANDWACGRTKDHPSPPPPIILHVFLVVQNVAETHCKHHLM